MANLKSIALGLCTRIFFMLAFALLFFSIVLSFLPADFEIFKQKAEQELPQRIVDSHILDGMVGSDIANGANGAQLRGMLASQLRGEIRNALNTVSEWVEKAAGFLPFVAIGFLINFTIATCLVWLESKEKFVHNMFSYLWRFFLVNFISMLIIWLLIPVSSEWMVKQTGEILASTMGSRTDELPMDALIRIIVNFFLGELRLFFIKPMAIYAAVAVGSWIGMKSTMI